MKKTLLSCKEIQVVLYPYINPMKYWTTAIVEH